MVINKHTFLILKRIVFILSIVLFFFTIPHTLEDFMTGEPTKAGIPAALLSIVVSTLIALQAMGIYWLGQEKRRGFVIHIGVGVFWPLASGLAQLPAIFSGNHYRSGVISVLYVFGILLTGVMLICFSLLILLLMNKLKK